jgi:DNA replication and repair protein RecF
MRLTGLRITNFRNIGQAELDFQGARQFFCGSNGQGKTNLLEAIGMITAMRSFRTTKRLPLLRADEPHASIRANLELAGGKPIQVDIRLSRAVRKAFVDEAPFERFSDFIGNYPTVTLSSGDIQFLRGAPALRRRFFDLILSFGEPPYLEHLRKYHNTLKHRNALLKLDNPRPQLPAFDQLLAAQASAVTQLRRDAIRHFHGYLVHFYNMIAQSGKEVPSIAYIPSKAAESPSDFLGLYQTNLGRDLHAGTTTIGPHRDDFSFELNGYPAEEYASEGQQRALVLSLRFAQFAYFKEKSGTLPVLLADDILGELDPIRRERFWQAIDEETQLVATGTTLPDDPAPWQTFQVDNGTFS